VQKVAQAVMPVPVESKPADLGKGLNKDDQNAAVEAAKPVMEAVNGEKSSVKKEKKEKTEKKEKEAKKNKEGKEKKDKKRKQKQSPEVDNALSHATADVVTNGDPEIKQKKKEKKRKASPEVDNSLSHASAEVSVTDLPSDKKKVLPGILLSLITRIRSERPLK